MTAHPPGGDKINRRVLVMDDEDAIRQLIVKVLSRSGLDVRPARNGTEALDLVRSAIQQQRPFDLLILDILIPGERGALSILPDIRAMDANVKVVVSSGMSNTQDSTGSTTGEIAAFLPKPFNINVLRDLMVRLLAPPAANL